MTVKDFAGKLVRSPSVGGILLPALAILFGLQLLRVFIPQMAWLLGDRFGLSAVILGVIALVIFSFSFLAGSLGRLAGGQRLVVYTAGGLGLARLLVQLQWPDPLVNLSIAIIGTILFGLFLAAYLDEARLLGDNAVGNLAVGLLAGLILDTALNGAFGTYDIAWQSGLLALLITIVLVLIHWLIIAGRITAFRQNDRAVSGTGGRTWPWLAIGPFLFLQMVVLQNIPRWAVTTGWATPHIFGWLLLAQIIALFAAVGLLKKDLRYLLPAALIGSIVLVVAAVFPYPGQPWLAAIAVFAAQVAISILMFLIIVGTGARSDETRFSSVTVPNGLGTLVLGLFTLGYYTVYQINLPYTNTVLEPVAAAVVALCALGSCLMLRKRTPSINISWLAPSLALVLFILPLVGIISWREPEATAVDGFPVTVMTYNLHNGFNTDGDLDMEALALVIEESEPDIVALQEISRGWLVSGRLDMLTWLSQRLDMPYISGPTAGPLWGNAILSRYPIIESTSYELPTGDLFILRGFLLAKLDIGDGESLNIIATHFHHVDDDSEIRQLQVPVILEAWNGAGGTVITGDLNAEPDAPEIEMLREAGLLDVMAEVNPPEGFTYHSAEPARRIDYIWISPDLGVRKAQILSSRASDHLPVIVEIYR